MPQQEDIDINAVKGNSRYFYELPAGRRTEAVSLAAVKRYPFNLNFVPLKHLSDRIMKAALEQDGQLLEILPEKRLTAELCKTAIENNPHALGYVPKKLKTRDMCMLAISRNGFALQYAGPGKVTRRMCNLAVKNTKEPHLVMWIPYPGICMKVLRRCKNDGERSDFVRHIHPQGWSKRLAGRVIDIDPAFIRYVPDSFKTKKLTLKALEKNACVLPFVDDRYKTEKVCREAIKNDCNMTGSLPEQFRTESFYMSLVRDDPKNLKAIPPESRTKELCETALRDTYYKRHSDISVVPYVNHPGLCMDIIRRTEDTNELSFAVMAMSDEVKNAEMAGLVADKCPLAFDFIPEKYKTQEMYNRAVWNMPEVFTLVPLEMRTPQMCLHAVKANPDMYDYVPGAILNGKNIFTYSQAAEKKFGFEMSLSDTKELLAGRPLTVKVPETVIDGKRHGYEIRIDPEENRMIIKQMRTDAVKRQGLAPEKEKKRELKPAVRQTKTKKAGRRL